jgi:FixJ family two-component response regulator
VEDDAAVRAATENLVKSLGFDVYAFASAQEFLLSHREAETACLIVSFLGSKPSSSDEERLEPFFSHRLTP